MTRISVILPFYNDRLTLKSAVESILDQSYSDFELLLLDDGSTDGSSDIAASLKDPRIKRHRFPHRGLAPTLNDGLRLAAHEIIARMDADDIALHERFERQLRKFLQLPPNTFLSCRYGVFRESVLKYIIHSPEDSASIKQGLLLHSYISHPGLMFRRDMLLELGGFVSTAPEGAFEDYETWLAYKEKIEFLILPEVLMLHRYRRNSLSNNLLYKQRAMYSIQQRYYDDLPRYFGIHLIPKQNVYRGWREYFFGDRARARMFWLKRGVLAEGSLSMIPAFLFTLLPEKMFLALKEMRIRFRILYFFIYWSSDARRSRNALRRYSRGIHTE